MDCTGLRERAEKELPELRADALGKVVRGDLGDIEEESNGSGERCIGEKMRPKSIEDEDVVEDECWVLTEERS